MVGERLIDSVASVPHILFLRVDLEIVSATGVLKV